MFRSLKKAASRWLDHDPFTQSAATAYYAIFSMPGLLVIVLTVAAMFLDESQVEAQVMSHISHMIGPDTANDVDEMVDHAQRSNKEGWRMLVGIITLLFGATGVFAHLQRSLNNIWQVEVRKSAGIKTFLLARATSLGVILAIGFLLLVSLSVTSFLTLLSEWLSTKIPEMLVQGLSVINVFISLASISLLFALIFKVLPDVKLGWMHAIRGGVLSALLFTLGEYLMNFYFEMAKPASSFGAAGSLVLLMLWVFYSCMILLLGAEFTRTEAERSGRVHLEDYATKQPS